jgi:hypothetical protein
MEKILFEGEGGGRLGRRRGKYSFHADEREREREMEKGREKKPISPALRGFYFWAPAGTKKDARGRTSKPRAFSATCCSLEDLCGIARARVSSADEVVTAVWWPTLE